MVASLFLVGGAICSEVRKLRTAVEDQTIEMDKAEAAKEYDTESADAGGSPEIRTPASSIFQKD